MLGNQIFSQIIIDGTEKDINEIDSNNGQVYLEAGKHNIQYVFKNGNTEIPSGLFQNCESLTHLEIPEHFTVANYALDGTMLDNINEYILNFPASYYHDKYYVYLGPIRPTVSNIAELLRNEQYTKVIPLSDLSERNMLPKKDETDNKKYFNIDRTDNGQLYLLIWSKWVVDNFEMGRYEWPGISVNDTHIYPEYYENHEQEKHYYLDFGYDQYICFILDSDNIGEYEIHLLNSSGEILISYQQGYEMYDNEGILITKEWVNDDQNPNLCEVSHGVSKYYQNISYTGVNIDDKIYYIQGRWDDDFTTIFDLYDDHLIKTDKKIKFYEYILN